MSAPNALATVTATLHHLLSNVAPGVVVTTKSPSVARVDNTSDQINIFLYGIHYNPTFRNSPMPGEVRRGESAFPPMPLVLKYLITSYGAGDDDISGQEVLGQAMSLLHDHPLLGRTDIEGITPDSDLQNQIETVRITPDVLTLDDMSKLWTSFQSAEYRLSTGYEVSVVLIQSARASKTPLPVLTRGENDQGVTAQADLVPPYPALTEISWPNQQLSVTAGDVIIIDGHHLDGDAVVVRFSNTRLTAPIEVPVQAGGSANQISVKVPDDPANWVVGLYNAEAIITKGGEPERTTNTLPFSLAPKVTISPANPVARDGSGNVTLTVTFNPEVRPEQRVSLLLGDREIVAGPHPTQTGSLNILIEDAPIESRFVRLRVDGVDSQLIDHSVTPPVFNPAMEVIIT